MSIMDRTSHTHPLDLSFMKAGHGTVAMTGMPGRQQEVAFGGPWKRDLHQDMHTIREAGAERIVCLMETRELLAYKVEIGTFTTVANDFGMAFHHLPIVDGATPDITWADQWLEEGPEIHRVLADGHTIAIHCRGGFGRTGTLAAQILVELGTDPEAAMRHVRDVRPGTIETSGQEAYIRALRS